MRLLVRIARRSREQRRNHDTVVQRAGRHPGRDSIRLGLKAGAQFVVLGDRDVVILKVLEPPARDDFDALVGRSRQVAKKTGLTRADVKQAVVQVRRSR